MRIDDLGSPRQTQAAQAALDATAAFDEPTGAAETVVRGTRRFVANHSRTTTELHVGGRPVVLPGYGAAWIESS